MIRILVFVVLCLLPLYHVCLGATMENQFLSIDVNSSGRYSILDKRSGVTWRSSPYVDRFGQAVVTTGQEPLTIDLRDFVILQQKNALHLMHNFSGTSDRIEVILELKANTLRMSYHVIGSTALESINLLDNALWTTDEDRGYAVVPTRVGALIRADSGKESVADLYEDLEMWMLGIVKKGSALLITWDIPYVRPRLQNTLTSLPGEPCKQVLSTTLRLRKLATYVELHFLGKGDYLTIAKAYRNIAKRRGLLVTWDEKLKQNPERHKLLGAACFRIPRLMERIVDENGNEHANMKVSFDDAIKIAEHLKYALKIDKALFIMAGWVHYGYDNRHPDILPAAPECGGNEGFAGASKRIQELGYLFCPHDNYQDVYRNAPSYSQDIIRKNADGSLMVGGRWEGGQACIACPKQAINLAKCNLPEVKRLFDPNAYFIDTTFCVDLDECFDPAHPLNKLTDLQYRTELCDYARSLFGILGSEDGKEWAIPHSDFFEGLSCVSGYSGTQRGVIPLFGMVYNDCIVVYGKYGYDVNTAAPYVLHQLRQGMPLNYHFEPCPLYWKQPEAGQTPVNVSDGWDQPPSCFARADNGWAQGMCRMDCFLKNTYEITSPLHNITAHTQITGHRFLDSEWTAQEIEFGRKVYVVINEKAGEVVYQSRYGGKVVLPRFGFLIESPEYIAFHALQWNGLAYKQPVLFTIRSLDGKPIHQSKKVRIYHGFGDSKVKIGDRTINIDREAIVSMG
ncbi:MAG: hypothetical protein K6U00_00675 [Armatimonadetes bacterium]|nr:hypothetical protein [Armatimonadota bacterium]